MKISIQFNQEVFEFDGARPFDISIPLNLNGDQPNVYDVEKAGSVPCEAENLIGDTRRGGSCNFEQYTFIPHCNGTHTECVGHITRERISVRSCLKDVFIPARLISVMPENALNSEDSYPVEINSDDLLITKASIENALKNPKPKIQKPKSLIVRTLPNDASKKTRRYMENLPPFFSFEAIETISEKGFEHLVVDLPSIDRTFDEGRLSNHRAFWNVEPASFELNEKSFPNRTITELIFVPNELEDGDYLLNLQITAFESDATPSRPVLFRLI